MTISGISGPAEKIRKATNFRDKKIFEKVVSVKENSEGHKKRVSADTSFGVADEGHFTSGKLKVLFAYADAEQGNLVTTGGAVEDTFIDKAGNTAFVLLIKERRV